MSPGLLDPGIRGAVEALRALPGVETVASCQGRRRTDDRSTHADLAYVRFAEPVPLRLEHHLVEALGALAHVDPLEVRARWPEGNTELGDALVSVTRDVGASLTPVEVVATSDRPTLLASVEHRLVAGHGPWGIVAASGGVLATVDDVEDDPTVAFAVVGPERSEALALEIAEAFPEAIDPRLVERDGPASLLPRLAGGRFGERPDRAWRAALEDVARAVLWNDLRTGVAAAGSLDLHFGPGTVDVVRTR